jgi:hypothetical protein
MTESSGSNIPEDGGDSDDFDRISEEDLLERIETNLDREIKSEIEIPLREFESMRRFLECFNVIGAGEVTDEQLEDIWYRLTKDHTIGPEYSHMPGIYPGVLKDFAYLITDFNTKLNLSALPMSIKVDDFMRHASGIETRDFSPRLWMINDKAVPNLSALGMDKTEVFDNAVGDKEGLVRRSEVTRFLGWLVGQNFLKQDMPEKLNEFMKKNGFEKVTLTRIASVAIIGVIDKLEELENHKNVYQSGYPVQPAAVERYHDIVQAMSGIRQWAEVLILGEPAQI